MKRVASSVAHHTRSKKPKLFVNSVVKSNMEMISATSLHNFMIGDSLVDWLKLRSRPGTRKSPVYSRKGGFSEFIMHRGTEFEKELVKYIDMSRLPIITVSEYLTDEGCQKTIELMHQGVPALHSAPVKNMYNHTQGVIDLLIRSDYLSNLIDENPLTQDEAIVGAPKLGRSYHYVVVDIKFSTLPLRSDGIHLLNSGHYPAYKAQTYIYNEAIGQIQGYTPPYAFILGRRWHYTQQCIPFHNYTCLNRLGKVDFEGVDFIYKERTKEAIKWARDVRQQGSNWSLNPPSRIELYPNMCVDSGIWNSEKEKIAENIGEITTIWHLGIKHRNKAISSNILSWRDKKCITKNIDFNGSRASTIDKIMAINRQTQDKIRPKKIKSDISSWRDSENELFVDFETLADIFSDFKDLPHQNHTDMIFMIGVGFVKDGIWSYKNFTCANPTYEEEYRIMNEFVTFVSDFGHPKIRYWCAESNFWNKAECRQFDIADKNGDIERKDHISDDWQIFYDDDWCDLYNLFQKEPIVLKGCFKFGLKPIAKTMYAQGLIKTNLQSQCDSGMTAMVNAANCYDNSSNPLKSDTMLDIIRYNEFDCKVLWEILSYLRSNHA